MCRTRLAALSIATLSISAAAALTGCTEPAPAGRPSASNDEPAAPHPSHLAKNVHHKKASARRAASGDAARMLAKLRVRPESSGAGYRRASFVLWIQQRGCTTRQDVLREELRSKAAAACQLDHGVWRSAYDGEVIRNSTQLDIDHVVPLRQAYVSGAQRWNYATRRRYANDLGYPGSLRAVSARSNRQKGDSDPAEWLPSRAAFRCKYIGTWIAVKYRWRLTVDNTERAVLRRYVERCGRQADVPMPKRATVRDKRRVAGKPSAGSKPRAKGSTDRRYATCAEAIAHGLGPYRQGVDPEYAWYRDGDGDGVDCER